MLLSRYGEDIFLLNAFACFLMSYVTKIKNAIEKSKAKIFTTNSAEFMSRNGKEIKHKITISIPRLKATLLIFGSIR
jgi:organic hydroperoxide reductase OsmC/OhrA